LGKALLDRGTSSYQPAGVATWILLLITIPTRESPQIYENSQPFSVLAVVFQRLRLALGLPLKLANSSWSDKILASCAGDMHSRDYRPIVAA
jgi:hypothetical protein